MTVNKSNQQEERDALRRFCAGFSTGGAPGALEGTMECDDFVCPGNLFCPFG